MMLPSPSISSPLRIAPATASVLLLLLNSPVTDVIIPPSFTTALAKLVTVILSMLKV